jgi:hypothetical protein
VKGSGNGLESEAEKIFGDKAGKPFGNSFADNPGKINGNGLEEKYIEACQLMEIVSPL